MERLCAAGDQILRQSMLAEADKTLGFKIIMATIVLNDPAAASDGGNPGEG